MKNTVDLMEQLYKKLRFQIEEIAMPLLLLFWPLIKVAQGVDVSDSTYSLGNYLFADKLDGVWVISTYLSNLLGAFIVRLPKGATLLGANIYTGLIVSIIALSCYYLLKSDFTAPVMFLGEFIAINFCWIPTGILYNYLTYLLFSLGAIFLFIGIKKDSDPYLVIAGIILGLNVFVRIPNVLESALIIAVIASCVIRANQEGKKKGLTQVIFKKIGVCVAGYIVGVAIPLIAVIATYGIDGIIDMITGLGAISESSEGYSFAGMIIATLKSYIRSSKWLLIILAVIFAGTLMMAAVKRNKALKWCGRIAYLLVVLVMLRFFWGRGMFSFRYYEDYTSMFEWGMLTLFVAIGAAVTVLVRKNYNLLLKTYAVITLVIIVITPLGSNNYTCQNLNNMFLVLPFTIYVIGGWLYRGVHRIRLEGIMYGCNFPWMSMLILLSFMVIMQTTLFHTEFVFRDGMDGVKRDTVIGENREVSSPKDDPLHSIRGMRTSEKNAEALTGLCENIALDGSRPEAAIFWGDCPGLSYVLGIPSAISTTWPDLDSYAVATFDEDLMKLSVSEDADRSVVIWHKIDSPSGNNAGIKADILLDYIVSRHMNAVYENADYIIYK